MGNDDSGRTPAQLTICMGSSCFARGNARNLETIQSVLRQRGWADRVRLSGALCQGRCNCGPNLVFDGTAYQQLDPVAVLDLLEFHLQSRGKG